jgi:hypothetical protein
MDQPATNSQGTAMPKPLLPLGTTMTVLLMLGLCVPLGWYAIWLLGRHDPAVSLSGLPVMELLPAAVLLALPFAALRLLRIEWRAEP